MPGDEVLAPPRRIPLIAFLLLAGLALLLTGLSLRHWQQYRTHRSTVEEFRQAAVEHGYLPGRRDTYRVFAHGALEAWGTERRRRQSGWSTVTVTTGEGATFSTALPEVALRSGTHAWLQKGIPAVVEYWWPEHGAVVIRLQGHAYRTVQHPGWQADQSRADARWFGLGGLLVAALTLTLWRLNRRPPESETAQPIGQG